MLWQAALFSEGNIMELLWAVLAISTGVVMAKAVKLYTNL